MPEAKSDLYDLLPMQCMYGTYTGRGHCISSATIFREVTQPWIYECNIISSEML